MTFQKNPLIASAAVLCGAMLVASVAWAKLPAPTLTDEAKAKAEEAKAKTAWSGKVNGYKLCKSQDAVAAAYFAAAKKAGKDAKPAVAVAACADPGPFVYVPAGAASAAAAAKPAAVAVAAKAPAKPAPKK